VIKVIQSSTNKIWGRWIFGFSILIILAGFYFAIIQPFILPQVPDPFLMEITGLFRSDIPIEQVRYNNLLLGVSGALMMGWGTMILFLGYKLMDLSENWIWIAISTSLIVWYICDSLISLIAGSFLNFILNTIILLLALPPLIANIRIIIKIKCEGSQND
jgi:hypothetical protein